MIITPDKCTWKNSYDHDTLNYNEFNLKSTSRETVDQILIINRNIKTAYTKAG